MDVLQAVTFDFWNTLYGEPEGRTVLDLRLAGVGDVLRREGLCLEDEAIAGLFREAWAEAWRQQRFSGRDIGPWGQVRFMADKLGLKSSQVIEDIYEAYTCVLLIRPPSLNPGVKEALDKLCGRMRMAVICNTGASPGLVLRKILHQDGILDFFDFLTFSDEVGVAKPNPEIFRFTLDKLGVVPEKAAHVGDDGITDIIGAKRVGMFAVWINGRAEWALPECDRHIRSLDELPSVVECL